MRIEKVVAFVLVAAMVAMTGAASCRVRGKPPKTNPMPTVKLTPRPGQNLLFERDGEPYRPGAPLPVPPVLSEEFFGSSIARFGCQRAAGGGWANLTKAETVGGPPGLILEAKGNQITWTLTLTGGMTASLGNAHLPGNGTIPLELYNLQPTDLKGTFPDGHQEECSAVELRVND